MCSKSLIASNAYKTLDCPDCTDSTYVHAIAKDSETIVISLYRSRKYKTMIYLLKNQIGQKQGIAAIICSVLFNRHCQALTDFQGTYAALWVMNYILTSNSNPTVETYLVSRYSIVIIMSDVRIS